MTRHVICFEGKRIEKDLRLLERNALVWDKDAKFPITVNFNQSPDHIIGHAFDIRRENDVEGSITAEIFLYNDTEELRSILKESGYTIAGDKIVGDGAGNIQSLRLRGITLSNGVPWRAVSYTNIRSSIALTGQICDREHMAQDHENVVHGHRKGICLRVLGTDTWIYQLTKEK